MLNQTRFSPICCVGSRSDITRRNAMSPRRQQAWVPPPP